SSAHASALVFAPFSPHPASNGAHQGACMLMRMVQELGFGLTLASSTLFQDEPWTGSRKEAFERDFGAKVHVYEPRGSDQAWCSVGFSWRTNFETSRWCPPGLRAWFEALLEQEAPDLLLVNYAKWAPFACSDAARGVTKVLQSHDLLSLNAHLQARLKPHFTSGPYDLAKLSPSVIRQGFFEAIRLQAVEGLEAELAACDAFDLVIAVSDWEAEVFRQRLAPSQVHHLPMVFDARELPNQHAGPPIFLAAMNWFNLQGLAFFVQRVLPIILRAAPDFRLRVAGPICRHLLPTHGLELLGFVDDLDALYADARFSICPLLGGTGQQVKVMESMACGVPVVAFEDIALACRLEDGRQGLVAKGPEDMARACLRLWEDGALAVRLGAQGKAFIRERHSFREAVHGLELALKSCRRAPRVLA
ncbi:MAG TPA: glycosyltransferase family 4 protein, partial [Holophaga sp.]|nr:glycosyltransferase family 4 protein [Holophaga sp.]